MYPVDEKTQTDKISMANQESDTKIISKWVIIGIIAAMPIAFMLSIGNSSSTQNIQQNSTNTEKIPTASQSSYLQKQQYETCSKTNAEAELLKVASVRVVSLIPNSVRFRGDTRWDEAGPCSWFVTGSIIGINEMTREMNGRTFSAAVARERNGSYSVDMFQITGSPQ